jgi:hypothetical protein
MQRQCHSFSSSQFIKRMTVWGSCAVLSLQLMGCGGGGVQVDVVGPIGAAPVVAFTTSKSVAYRGESIELRASIVADNGVDFVSFYRIDYGVSTPLGTVTTPPARWLTSVPINAGVSTAYFVRVCDFEGLCTVSSAASVAVLP